MKKDAYYFKHDSNARHDPKIKALIGKYGIEGYGRFWVIIENLRESSNYKLNNKKYVWEALANDMNIDAEDVKKFVDYCAEIELLEKTDDFFYSMSLMQRMNELDEIREKRKMAAHKSWENR